MNKHIAPKGSKIKKHKNMTNKVMVCLMMLPGLLYLLINNYLPMYGITMAFREPDFSLDNVLNSPFNGFENFKFLFENDQLGLYIRNTVLYNMVFLILNIIIPVTMAILFANILGKRIKRFYQTAILLPYLMSWVVVSYIAFALLSTESGMLNGIIQAFGGKKIDFYSEEALAFWPFLLTFFNMWKGVGFSFLFYYSSIIAIDPALFEAAKLDGASFRQQIRYITLPSIKPTIIMMFILGISRIFSSDYGLFYLVTKNSGPLYPVTQTIDTFIFNSMIGSGDIVSSSAAGFLQAIIGFVLIIGSNLIIRKVDSDSAMF